jgi:hypothetical protein
MNKTVLLVALLFGVGATANGQTTGPVRALSPAERAVMSVEEQYRLAQLNNDTQALKRILADKFYETNQNGNSRNKAQTIELWTAFHISARTTEQSDIRLTGSTALVTGSETEQNGTGVDRMLFMRTYVRTGNGWRLLGAVHFRNPKLANR